MLGNIIITILAAVIFVPISGFVLWLTSKLFQQKEGFGTALVIVLKLFLIMLVPLVLKFFIKNWFFTIFYILIAVLVWFPISWLLIKHDYKTGYGTAVLIWLVWTAISFFINLVLGILFWLVMLFFGLAGYLAFAGL